MKHDLEIKFKIFLLDAPKIISKRKKIELIDMLYEYLAEAIAYIDICPYYCVKVDGKFVYPRNKERLLSFQQKNKSTSKK